MARKRTGNAPNTDTAERIADAALALFNAEGWQTVSTRHIAGRLGISPGNLYYHFANKEEITLRLYDRIERQLDSVLALPAGAYGSFDDILDYLDAILAHLWEFRFFYRDLNPLLREVPGLKDKYRALAQRLLGRARRIFAGMVEAGWMDATDEQLDLLATNAWIILTQWFTHRQVMDRRRTIRSSDIREGLRHLVALFSPSLHPPQRRQVQRLLGQSS